MKFGSSKHRAQVLGRDGTQRDNEIVHKFLQGKEAQIWQRYRKVRQVSIENFARYSGGMGPVRDVMQAFFGKRGGGPCKLFHENVSQNYRVMGSVGWKIGVECVEYYFTRSAGLLML